MNLGSNFGERDLKKITLATTLELREKKRHDEEKFKDRHKKEKKEDDFGDSSDDEDPNNPDLTDEQRNEILKRREQKKGKRLHNKVVQREKIGMIGHFAQPKAMLFDNNVNSLLPEKDDGKPKKLIDLTVVKKGL